MKIYIYIISFQGKNRFFTDYKAQNDCFRAMLLFLVLQIFRNIDILQLLWVYTSLCLFEILDIIPYHKQKLIIHRSFLGV